MHPIAMEIKEELKGYWNFDNNENNLNNIKNTVKLSEKLNSNNNLTTIIKSLINIDFTKYKIYD